MNRADRRAQAARAELAERRHRSVALLAVGLAIKAKFKIISRKEARRRLDAETVRRFGKLTAGYMAPRLPPAKALEALP